MDCGPQLAGRNLDTPGLGFEEERQYLNKRFTYIFKSRASVITERQCLELKKI